MRTIKVPKISGKGIVLHKHTALLLVALIFLSLVLFNCNANAKRKQAENELMLMSCEGNGRYYGKKGRFLFTHITLYQGKGGVDWTSYYDDPCSGESFGSCFSSRNSSKAFVIAYERPDNTVLLEISCEVSGGICQKVGVKKIFAKRHEPGQIFDVIKIVDADFKSGILLINEGGNDLSFLVMDSSGKTALAGVRRGFAIEPQVWACILDDGKKLILQTLDAPIESGHFLPEDTSVIYPNRIAVVL